MFFCALMQVLAEVQRRTADSVNRAADNFERYEAATNMHVPPELYLQQVIMGLNRSLYSSRSGPSCHVPANTDRLRSCNLSTPKKH